MKDRTARGTAIVNLLPLQPDETIQAIIDTRDYETSRFLFFATKKGQVKKTKFTEYDSSRRDGLIAINLKDGDELVRVIQTNGDDDIFMVAAGGQTIRFTEDDVRPMGRSAAGVRGMKLREGDEVVSCAVTKDDADILIVTEAGYGKRTKLDKYPVKGRGTMGVRGIKLTGRKGGYVVAAFMVGTRRRDLPGVVQRHADPHGRAADLVPGPRRHRRAGHEPRRRRDGGRPRSGVHPRGGRRQAGPRPHPPRRRRIAPTPLVLAPDPGARGPKSGARTEEVALSPLNLG